MPTAYKKIQRGIVEFDPKVDFLSNIFEKDRTVPAGLFYSVDSCWDSFSHKHYIKYPFSFFKSIFWGE